ncbi:hypothetical protein J7E55_25880 [Bacillus sp. ISL-53]|nr:hypothetical protein [Bacillus sp. ISL-53]
MREARHFLHIITDYDLSDWGILKKKMYDSRKMDLTDYLPVFLRVEDFLFPFDKQVTLIINEWRKYKKVAVIVIDHPDDLNKLPVEKVEWLKNNAEIFLKS